MSVTAINITTESKQNILKTILSSGIITKSKLSEVLNIRPATVIPIVNSLFDSKIITINTAEKKGRSVFYQINPQAKFSIGVNINNTGVEAVLIDLSGKIYFKKKSVFAMNKGTEDLYKVIIETIDCVLCAKEYDRKKNLGIGIAAPGIINNGKSTATIAPWWENLPLQKIVANKFAYPVFIENDVRAALIAERWLGTTCGSKNTVFFDIRPKSGVGMAILQNDKIFKGSRGGSTEFGHITIKYDGEFCKCGNRGCLEYYLSHDWLKSRLTFYRNTDIQTNIIIDDDDLLNTLISQANKNDKIAIIILEELAEFVGIGMTTAVNLFNPSRVVIGGDIVNCEKWFFDIVRQTMRKYAWKSYLKNTEMSLSNLGKNSGAIGAAILLFYNFFSDSFPNQIIKSS